MNSTKAGNGFYAYCLSGLLVLLTYSWPVQAQDNPQPDRDKLTASITHLISGGPASSSLWSIVVRDSSNTPITAINSDMLVRPASNLKLLTSAAILDQLGPDYRFETQMYISGEIRDSTLFGDIHFLGGGDPTIDRHNHNNDPLIVMYAFVQALFEKGIVRVQGDIFGNVSLFDDVPYPRGWEWDDLSYYYAPEISPLSFNGNTVYLKVDSNGPVGSTPGISWFPMNTDFVEFINEQLITPANSRFDEQYRRILGSNVIILRSSVPRGFVETEPLSITNPPMFFMDTFRKFAASQGLEMVGEMHISREKKTWETYTLVHTHYSPPLSEILKSINQDSDNFYTEMLLKYIAAKRYQAIGSTELGLAIVSEFAQSQGMNPSQIRMRDGSGMAPATLITGNNIVQLLYAMQQHAYFETYFQSLAVAGVDARLRNRFHGSPLYRSINGKTGFISGTRSLSGYLKTENDTKVMFSIITNNYVIPTRQIDAIHQQILELIYSHY